MWNEIQQRAKTNLNFLQHRWDNPLHNEYDTELQGRLWPSSEEFYHPLNPLYSFFFRTYTQLNFYELVLLKDGAIGILDFFLRFPIPRQTRTHFFINADLLFLVPEAWRSQVTGYRLTANHTPVPTKKYLFYALLSDSFLAWPHFKEHIQDWLKQFDPQAPASAFFAHRTEIYDHSWSDRKMAMEVTAAVQHHFTRPVEFLNWNETKALSAKADVTYVNMDLRHYGTGLCAVDSLMLGKAAQVAPRGRYAGLKGDKIGEWPLSFQHGLEFFNAQAEHDDFAPFLFLKKLSPYTSAHLPLPIKSNLMELMAERVVVTPFGDAATTNASAAKR